MRWLGARRPHRRATEHTRSRSSKPNGSGLVETLLASQKVSKDVRGRLQSHGVSDVQARHYDCHEYIDEKREGLDALYVSLTRKAPAKAIARKATTNNRTRRRAVSP